MAHDAGRTVILNAAPATTLPDSLLSLVDYLIVNETELFTVAGPAALDQHAAVASLHDRGAGAIVVTLGAAGARLVPRDGGRRWCMRTRWMRWTRQQPVTHSSGPSPWRSPKGCRQSRRFAAATPPARCTVTRPGAQPSLPTRGEVDAWLMAHA